MDYEVTIGLEVHAQILTDSKMFCGCSARYWDAEPNTHVCPVCLGLPGALPVANRRVHIEEDTGKLVHQPDGSSLVDFNRAGVPLMEIVSEPDIASPEQAKRYFQKLRQILIWIGVNTGNMEAGALRCDANVSVRPRSQQKYGAKVEIKNMNSFRAVERALAYEIERQIKALKAGQTILQTTRGWDEAHGITVEQRSKEFAEDYRYFPDPDIPPLQIAPKWVEELRTELPDARRARFMTEYELSAYDADTLTIDRGVADYYERAVAAGRALGVAPKEVANWCLRLICRPPCLNSNPSPPSSSSAAAPRRSSRIFALPKRMLLLSPRSASGWRACHFRSSWLPLGSSSYHRLRCSHAWIGVCHC
jgi:Asp-tRNA(Asn)/Glu-tRNA(Gln) amidotransferase B subunit